MGNLELLLVPLIIGKCAAVEIRHVQMEIEKHNLLSTFS